VGRFLVLGIIRNIDSAYNEVFTACLNRVWRRLYGNIVQRVPGFEKGLFNVIEEITHTVTQTRIERVGPDCVGFLSSQGEPFTEEELHEADNHVTFEELSSVPMTASLKTSCFYAVCTCLYCSSMTNT